MTTPIDAGTLAWLDQEDRRTAQTIREHGVSIEAVMGDSVSRHTPFAYTVGLFGLGHPELLVFGLEYRTSNLVLNDVSAQVRSGRDLVPGEVIAFEHWSHRVVVETVPNPGEIVFAANRFYSRPDEHSVGVLQLSYTDKAGRFPGERGYSIPAWVQPRPGGFRA